jgi:hypothetical protein
MPRTDQPTYDPKAVDLNTLVVTQAETVMQLRKRSEEQASPALREAVAEYVAAYGVLRAAARMQIAER